MNTDIPEALRELGDDGGRPLPTTGHEVVTRGRRTRRRRRLAGGIVVVAGVAAFALLAPTLSSPVPPTATTATSVLEQAAVASSEVVPGPGQYWLFTEQTQVSGLAGRVTYQYTETTETWIPRDLSQVWVHRQRSGAPYTFASAEDERRARAIGLEHEDNTMAARRGAFDGGPAVDEAREREWAALPRDPQELLARVRTTSPGSSDDHAFQSLAQLASVPFVPADLRSASFRALALVPGDTSLQQDARIGDRVGLGVARSANGFVQTLLFEPVRGQLVASQETVQGGEEPALPGGATGETYDLTIVDSAPRADTPTPPSVTPTPSSQTPPIGGR